MIEIVARDRTRRIRDRAVEALRDSDLSGVFEIAGIESLEADGGTAGAALKAVLAERLADYTIRAMNVARKRRIKLGAAAIILAAQQK